MTKMEKSLPILIGVFALIMVLSLFVVVLSIVKIEKEMKKSGYKAVTSEVWNGKDTSQPTGRNDEAKRDIEEENHLR